jgi:hypothetical protein
MSPRLPAYALLLLAPFAFALPVHAQESKNSEAVMMSSEGFLDAHPDIKHRQSGLRHWEAGEYDKAFEQFKRAARFADKPSQGMIAEMLWRGEGVAQDRPAAYAWMDLAAERHYRPMLIQREVYWDALSEAEREKAMEIGKDLYAEYGDDVAKPRVERKMRFARRAGTGGRTGGAIGNLTIVVNTMAGPMTIDGSTYYDPDYWEPERYWAWQEKGWKNPPRGMVDVGPLSKPAEAPAAPAPVEDGGGR